MEQFPIRKRLRLPNYDYSACGVYFLTICTQNRETLFWSDLPNERYLPLDAPLSDIGKIVDAEIQKMNTVYDAVTVHNYCIMPDHIHLLIAIHADEAGNRQFAPAIARVIKQFKGSVTKQLGKSIWQKSYVDHVIRNDEDYKVRWNYIENNPLKYIGIW